MNFDIVCTNCGAPSSPTVGVCPYCKSVMTSGLEKNIPVVADIKKYFAEGQIERALSLAKALEAQKPESLKSKELALLYAEILFEAESPSTKIRSLLDQSLIEHPSDPELLEYLEVAEAESNLSRQKDAEAEVALANVIRRSPENVYALFLLGSHLFWAKNDAQGALRYLEQCVRLRPNFFRAKGCLCAVYKFLKMNEPARKLCQDCAAKVSDPVMKQLFIDFANSIT